MAAKIALTLGTVYANVTRAVGETNELFTVLAQGLVKVDQSSDYR
jgi:hypothetical protein